MKENIKIRLITREDLTERDDLLLLLGQLTEVPIEDYTATLREDLAQWFCDGKGTRTEFILIAEIEGKIVGTAKILMERKIARLGAWVGHIEDVVTLEEFRGKGIASKIMGALEYYAKNDFTTYKMILDCEEENVPFYVKSGFTKDSVCMRKDIN